MTIHLYAAGIRLAKAAGLAALVLAALLIAAPVAAHAAGRTTTTNVLAEGTGMKAAHSVRVRSLQRALRQRGYHLGPAGVDGRFGPDTAAAVRRFQARKGLAVDGVVGPSTRRSLRRSPIAGRRSKKPARQHTGRADRSRPAQTHNGAAAPPAPSPSTAAPAPTQTTTPPTKPSTVPTPAAGPAPAPTSVGGGGTAWGVPIAIGAVAMSLLVLSLPLLWDPRRPRSERGRSAGTLATMRRGATPPDRSAAAAAAGGAAASAAVAERRNGAENNGRQAGRTKQQAAGAANGNGNGHRNGNGNGNGNGSATASLAPGDAVLGYVHVAEDHREASIRAIQETCDRAGWSLVDIVCDRANGTPGKEAPLTGVLERIAAGEIGGLVIGHDADATDATKEGGVLGLPSLAGPDFALHDLDVDAPGCDVALITLNGRRSPGGQRAVS